jgi:hypothetical protein
MKRQSTSKEELHSARLRAEALPIERNTWAETDMNVLAREVGQFLPLIGTWGCRIDAPDHGAPDTQGLADERLCFLSAALIA